MLNQFVLSSLTRDKLSVLLFHKVPRVRHPLFQEDLDLQEFIRSIDYIQNHFNVLPLNEGIDRLAKKSLPERSVCITFDDGYPDWIDGAIPMLIERKLPATLFITAGQFDGVPMWHERVLHSIGSTTKSIQALRTSFLQEELPFGSIEERRRAVAIVERTLKFQSASQREEKLVELEEMLGTHKSATPCMTEQQLRDIHSKGFEIGAHTFGHPILTNCSEMEAREEIGTTKEILAGITGSPIDAFAYPNGMPGRDFSSIHVDMVKRAGYKYAVTTGTGAARWNSSAFQIPRFTPWGPTTNRRNIQIARNILSTAKELPEARVEKRVLMVAFHFPPQPVSSGIFRTLNFVQNLQKSHWQPTVLTASHTAYGTISQDLLNSIPEKTKVVRGFALDTARHMSLHGRYPQWLAVPDRWSTWWVGGVIAGMQAVRKNRIDLIWSTYPIATSHMIAATLARLTGLPWIADFRDPMIGNPSNQFSEMRRKFVEKFEARVMREAAYCVFTTERAAENYRIRYPNAATKCCVIENGYDEKVFKVASPSRHGVAEDTLFLLHSGVIYPGNRNTSAFFEAAASLLNSVEVDRKRICIRFRSPEHGDHVLELARAHGISDVVEIAPTLKYKDAISEILAADILVVFQGSKFDAQIPAKIYEYLRAGRPILAIVNPGGSTAQRLEKFEDPVLADINSAKDIESGLRQVIALTKQPRYNEKQSAVSQQIIAVSREYQAKELVNLFDKAFL
jgi:peptidoglycan/xylan/chitin deacetylase (PgdA/CDA1 family)